MGTSATPAQEYARALHQNVLEWYRSADAKAQILLALVGTLLAFFGGSIFAAGTQLAAAARCMDRLTWSVLVAMALAVAASIGFGLACLWSRFRLPGSIQTELQTVHNSPAGAGYSARVMGFFGYIRKVDAERFRRQVQSMTAEREVDVLVAQIHALSRNVHRKHLLVNIGFVCGGTGLVLLLLAIALYTVRVTDGGCLSPPAAAATLSDTHEVLNHSLGKEWASARNSPR